jgi:hypothetical protein
MLKKQKTQPIFHGTQSRVRKGMGAKSSKSPIGTAQVQKLWSVYDPTGQGTIDRATAIKLLHDLAAMAEVPWDEDKAHEIIMQIASAGAPFRFLLRF